QISQRPSTGARENRKQIFDAQYIAEWINASFSTLHINADDIIRPTSEVVSEVYVVFTQHILGLSAATLTMPPFDIAREVDPDLFVHVMPKVVVFRSLSAIIEDLTEGQGSLTVNDLLTPNPRSTRRILSIVIDYMQFSQEINVEVNRTFAIHDEKKAELERRRNAIIELELEVADRRSQEDCLRRAENEKRAQMEQLYQKTREAVEKNTVLQGRHQAAVRDITEKDKRIEELQSELRSLTMHNELLTSKLVTSPERLESCVRDATERREAAIKEIDAKRRELSAEQERKRQRTSISNAIAQLVQHLQRIVSYEAQIASIQEKVAGSVTVQAEADDDLRAQKNMLMREYEVAKECDAAFEREEEGHAFQLKNCEQQIATVRSQIDDMRGRLEDVNKENVEVQREVVRLKDELSTMNRKSETESTKMANRLEGVLQKDAIDMIRESLFATEDDHSDTLSTTINNRSSY
uniref:Kinetochore protein Nuf2 N-terminal domain-containing protein n=1 Tax=Parascaris univalens TaxID=6257 RepID=A0A915CEK0_PARUN